MNIYYVKNLSGTFQKDSLELDLNQIDIDLNYFDDYKFYNYGLNSTTDLIDYENLEKIAKLIIKLTNSSSKIKNVKRNGPMPHNGYRSFNVSSLKKAFPNFKYHKISEALYKIKELY